MNTKNLRLFVGLLLLLFSSLPLLGQVGKSGISGTVTDQTGAVVPNAKVTIKNEATNLEWSTTTSGTGVYFVRNLPIGFYSVTAEAGSFQKVVIEHVQAEVEKITSLDFKLTIGTVTETLAITAPVEQLNTTSGTIGNLVTQHEIETLPLNGRSWMSLNFLTPGATKLRAGSLNGENPTEPIAPGGFVVNGLRGTMNQFFIDGVNLQSTEDQIIGIYPPLDAIQEFRTQSGNYTAEYFGGASAVVSAVTKSGTNQIHGAAWEYIRNSALDARSFFDGKLPVFQRNQFGFTFGAPIRKDRTFAFASYEGLRQRRGQTLIGDFPTAAQRTGDLSTLSGQVRDPLSGLPFPGNSIPKNRINSLAANWLNNWVPLPNTAFPVGQGNFRRPQSTPINYDSVIVRLDHRLSNRDSIFVRYMRTGVNQDRIFLNPLFNQNLTQPSANVALDYTHTFSPKIVAEGRVGYHRFFHNEPCGNALGADIVKELTGRTDPFGFTASSQPAARTAGGNLSITGFSSFGGCGANPRAWYNDSFYYDGLVFISHGSHAIKMGGSVTRVRSNFKEIINPVGSWSYNGFFSGLGFADYLLGYPRSVGTSSSQFSPDGRRWAEGIWFQDDWKATPRLTFNLGMRWDIDGRYLSKSDTISNVDLSRPPIITVITPKNRPAGWDRSLVDSPQMNLIAPRIGFAYKLTESTVVRGGYGIYWQPMTGDTLVDMSLNKPFVEGLGVTLDTTQLATFDLSNPFGIFAGSQEKRTGMVGVQKDFKDAYAQQWNFTVERTIGANYFSAGYVGNLSIHLITWDTGTNSPLPGPGTTAEKDAQRPWHILQGLPGYTVIAGVQYYDSSRTANYHGLQLQARRRIARNLSFIASYAWSKLINTGDGTYIEGLTDAFQQPRNPRAERAVGADNTPHVFTFSYMYVLPFGSGQRFLTGVGGAGGKLLSGWQITGMTRFLSGQPDRVFNAYDNLNNSDPGYPDRICDPRITRSRSSGEKIAQWFNTACFVPAGGGTIGIPNYTYGNAGRNVLTDPGLQLWDVALEKNTTFGERYRIEFRAECFNAFNHPNFAAPNGSFGSPQFGRIFGQAVPPRDIQFGLKFLF